MEKTLGLDLGTNSIGWNIRNPFLEGSQFEKYGVNIFRKGVGNDKSGEFSLAAERTKKRSVRRLYQSRKYRIWATLNVLIENNFCPLKIEELDQWRKFDKKKGLDRKYPVHVEKFEQWVRLDFDGDGKSDYTSPYQLRKELIEIKLDLGIEKERYKLGRALYHIAQRRGFKSSRKSGDKEDTSVYSGSKDSGAKGVNDIKEYIDKYGTLGAALAFIESSGERVRNQYTLRRHYQYEVNKIFIVQELSDKDSFYKNVVKSIFYQRPLRSQKGLIGKCTLESNKPRCPISHPFFEEFRAWSFINNVQYKLSNDKSANWVKPSLELKENLFRDKFFRKSKDYFPFSEIREYLQAYLKKQGDSIILNEKEKTINYKDNTTVSGCPVSARLKEIFGWEWKTIAIKKAISKSSKINNENYALDDIWHILFSFDDEEALADFAKEKLNLNDEQIKQFQTAWKQLPDGYAMLSLNAINKILPFLRKGFIYTESVLLANMPTVIGAKLWMENEQLLTDTIDDLIKQNRDEKKILNIVNNLIAKWYAQDHKFGFKNNTYQLDESDKNDIFKNVVDSFGKITWEEKSEQEKINILTSVTNLYQNFFRSDKREFYKLPQLLNTFKNFLSDYFKDNIDSNKLNNLYHPSQIDIYPKAKPDKEGMVLLSSPKTGSFKNPMAMRTLHELRKLINYLLSVGAIDEDTRIVVEIARELNDSNRRWAIETYQRRREEENQEFANAISELLNDEEVLKTHPRLKANPSSNDDIDKFRLWYEQLNHKQIFKREPAKPKNNKEGNEEGSNDPRKFDWTNIRTEIINNVITEKDLVKKYRLWKEQNCRCLYTGNIINLTDLFDENIVDFEHTIPRSISFDNSLANLTVCYADYNRNIKKNQIPTALGNYDSDWGNYKAIKPHLADWENKVESLKDNIEFWLKKSKRATDKKEKDDAIRQRHLWQFELDYWRNKLDRFTKTEITSGFKNSQLVDTQIISKYALHYLRTLFNKVDVQKGSITSEFRKIYGIQQKKEKKDRSKHSHHAIDAAVLTLIPSAARREEILQNAYTYAENNKGKQYHQDPYPAFNYNHVSEIENNILINNISKDQTLTPARKILRKRGKIVYLKDGWKGIKGDIKYDENGNKIPKIVQGDAIRGQLHQETFLGAIKKIKRENGSPLLEAGKFFFEEGYSFVTREPLVYKKDAQSAGFKTLEEIKSCIVDPDLYFIIEKQVGDKNLKDAIADGIFMLNKDGAKVNKIRHIRIFVKDKEPLTVKKQTYISNKPLKYLSDRKHKEFYYAGNAENYAYVLYEGIINGKIERDYNIINLFQAADLSNSAEKRTIQVEDKLIYNKKGDSIPLRAILKTGQKVLFLKDNNSDELKDLSISDLLKRLYKIVKFEKDGRIVFGYHLDARSEAELKLLAESYGKSIYNGFPTINFDDPYPKLRISIGNLNILIEDEDFEVAPDGSLIFLND